MFGTVNEEWHEEGSGNHYEMRTKFIATSGEGSDIVKYGDLQEKIIQNILYKLICLTIYTKSSARYYTNSKLSDKRVDAQIADGDHVRSYTTQVMSSKLI